MMLVRSDWLTFGHGFPMQPGDDGQAFRWRGRLIILVAAVVAVFILTAKLLLGQ
jgi:hypothetical protein